MKKLIILSILCIGILISFVNLDVSNKSAVLNLIALGDSFDFNGQSWDTEEHSYNKFGSNWRPEKKECECTENSGGGSIGIDFGVTVEVTFPSTSSTYPGHYISCVQGSGNCANGTDCVRD